MEAEKVVRSHCNYLSITGWVPTCRAFIEEDPWDQHLWKGGGRSGNGQRKMSFCDAGPTTASADRVGSSGARIALQSCPGLGSDR